MKFPDDPKVPVFELTLVVESIAIGEVGHFRSHRKFFVRRDIAREETPGLINPGKVGSPRFLLAHHFLLKSNDVPLSRHNQPICCAGQEVTHFGLVNSESEGSFLRITF